MTGICISQGIHKTVYRLQLNYIQSITREYKKDEILRVLIVHRHSIEDQIFWAAARKQIQRYFNF